MKRMNLTAAVLMTALSTPVFADNQPEELPPAPQVSQEQLDQIQKAIEELNASRAMTPEERERWGGNAWVEQIEKDLREQEHPNANLPEFIRGAFLGVNAEPLDLETAEKLGLKRSTGLLVTNFPGNGPAGKAGLKKGDVLTKFNNQILINAEQFAVLVRSQEIGDTVTLHGLRDGEPIKLEVKLGSADHLALGPGGKDLDHVWRLQLNPLRPEVEIAPGLWIGDGWGNVQLQGIDAEAMPEEVRKMIEKMQQQIIKQREDMDLKMKELRLQLDLDIEQLRGDFAAPRGNRAGKEEHQTTLKWKWSDGEHSLEQSNHNGKSHLKVIDRQGKTIYDGPMPAAGQDDALPDEIQKKVDRAFGPPSDDQLLPGVVLPDEELEISEQEDLKEGQWGYWSNGDYILKLTWNGKEQEMKIYAQHFAPWWLATVEDFRVDPKWQKGDADKLHVEAFDRLDETMQAQIYAMLEHKDIKPKLIAEEK